MTQEGRTRTCSYLAGLMSWTRRWGTALVGVAGWYKRAMGEQAVDLMLPRWIVESQG